MAEPLADFQGATLYLDSEFLVRVLDRVSPAGAVYRNFLTRALSPVSPVGLVTATLTIDEVLFVLLQEYMAHAPYNVTRSRSQYLQSHPEAVKALMPQIENELQPLLDLLTLEPVLPEDIAAMRTEMLNSGILPRDAIHLAVMRRLTIPAIASDDDVFDQYPDITRYKA